MMRQEVDKTNAVVADRSVKRSDVSYSRDSSLRYDGLDRS